MEIKVATGSAAIKDGPIDDDKDIEDVPNYGRTLESPQHCS